MSALRTTRDASTSESDGSACLERETSQTKRRPSRGGSRSVSNLSKEQLERKRQNDREAQRAIRQRTKDHIERLEREVVEWKNRSGAPDQSALIKEIDSLKAENSYLRLQLDRSQNTSPSSVNGQRTMPSGHPVWSEQEMRRSSGQFNVPMSHTSALVASASDPQQPQPHRFRPTSQVWQGPEPYSQSLKGESSPPSSARTAPQDYQAWGGMDRNRQSSGPAGSLEAQPFPQQVSAYPQMMGGQQAPQPIAYSQLPPLQPGQAGPPVQSMQPLPAGQSYHQGMTQYGPISQPYFQNAPSPNGVGPTTQQGSRDRSALPSASQHAQGQMFYQSYQQPPSS